MKKELFRFLENYSTDVLKINKLIVSSFLISKHYGKIQNKHIQSLIIFRGEPEYSTLVEFNEEFNIDSLEKVIEAFEYVISPEDKVVTGAIYTPSNIRKFIVKHLLKIDEQLPNITICDPACGCSGFLYTAMQEMHIRTKKSYIKIIEENIYGLDIKDYAIERSKILLTLLALENGEDQEEIRFNFFVGNALSFDWNFKIQNFKGFDLVIGNPPYVCSRNIDEESKKHLFKWKVSSTGHPDLYIPFFEIGLTILKMNGHLGFITMNSFFKSLNGRALRSYFSDEKYNMSIIDFGGEQVFISNSTYTCICIIQKKPSTGVKYAISSQYDLNKLSFTNIAYEALDDYSGWNLNLPSIIAKIEATGSPFSNLFKTSSGIATLKNDVFIFDPIREDDDFYYIDEVTPIEKGLCRDIVNTNKLTKVDNLDSIRKKVLFPYIYSSGQANVILEQELRENYPLTYAYLITKKTILLTRDKGNGKYEEWFAYGRKQALTQYKYKLFFPHIANEPPQFILSNEEDLLFYNGLALLSNDLRNLQFAQKIMQSKLFWFYIENTSKHYGSGYKSLSKNYIKSFGVYNFTEDDKSWIINEEDQQKVNCFIESKYDIELDKIKAPAE